MSVAAARTLNAAAARSRIRLNAAPADGELVQLAAPDVASLSTHTRNVPQRAEINAAAIRRILGTTVGETQITARDAYTIARALEDIARTQTRQDSIDRGTFSGPMSASETLRHWKGRHGLR